MLLTGGLCSPRIGKRIPGANLAQSLAEKMDQAPLNFRTCRATLHVRIHVQGNAFGNGALLHP